MVVGGRQAHQHAYNDIIVQALRNISNNSDIKSNVKGQYML